MDAIYGPSRDTSLILFRRAMTSSMNKLEAFAFTSDVIKQLDVEKEWSDRILPLFQDYFEELDARKALDIEFYPAQQTKNFIGISAIYIDISVKITNICKLNPARNEDCVYLENFNKDCDTYLNRYQTLIKFTAVAVAITPN